MADETYKKLNDNKLEATSKNIISKDYLLDQLAMAQGDKKSAEERIAAIQAQLKLLE